VIRKKLVRCSGHVSTDQWVSGEKLKRGIMHIDGWSDRGVKVMVYTLVIILLGIGVIEAVDYYQTKSTDMKTLEYINKTRRH